jgi:hypothetical protein
MAPGGNNRLQWAHIERDIPIWTDYMKHIHATEEIEIVFTNFNWATYFNLDFNRNFNFNIKIMTSSAANSLV